MRKAHRQMATMDWFKQESAKLAEEMPVGSKLETDLIEHWKVHSPKMAARMEKAGALEAAAHVLVDQMLEEAKQLRKAGMPATDAREQAEAGWLLMEPESEPESLMLEPIM